MAQVVFGVVANDTNAIIKAFFGGAKNFFRDRRLGVYEGNPDAKKETVEHVEYATQFHRKLDRWLGMKNGHFPDLSELIYIEDQNRDRHILGIKVQKIGGKLDMDEDHKSRFNELIAGKFESSEDPGYYVIDPVDPYDS